MDPSQRQKSASKQCNWIPKKIQEGTLSIQSVKYPYDAYCYDLHRVCFFQTKILPRILETSHSWLDMCQHGRNCRCTVTVRGLYWTSGNIKTQLLKMCCSAKYIIPYTCIYIYILYTYILKLHSFAGGN